nr:hypothetical protein Iba_chr14bCG17160 [Ipomoea batatas]
MDGFVLRKFGNGKAFLERELEMWYLFPLSRFEGSEGYTFNLRASLEDSRDSQEMGTRAKNSLNEEEDTIGVITDLAKHSRAKASKRARARTRSVKSRCYSPSLVP